MASGGGPRIAIGKDRRIDADASELPRRDLAVTGTRLRREPAARRKERSSQGGRRVVMRCRASLVKCSR